MKQKAIKAAALILILAMVLSLTACDLTDKDGTEAQKEETAVTKEETAASKEETAASSEETAATKEETAASAEETEVPAEPETAAPAWVELTEQEAMDIAFAFLKEDGNGLLQSVYQDSRIASLRDVVYQKTDESLAGQVDAALFAKYGYTYDPDCGATYISGKNLDLFLQNSIGYGLADMCSEAFDDLPYFKDEDIYALQHGDTNYQPLGVCGYNWDGKTLSITYTNDYCQSWFFFWGGDRTASNAYGSASRMKVTLEYQGDRTFRLLSNVAEEINEEKTGLQAEVEHLFNTPVVNGILHSSFGMPSQMVLTTVISQWGDCRDGEGLDAQALFAKYGWNWEEGPGCQMVSGTTMAAFVKRYMGADFTYFDNYQKGAYFQDENIYFSREGGVTFLEAKVFSVEQEDEHYFVRYSRGDGSGLGFYYVDYLDGQEKDATEMCATLARDDYGRLIIVSNGPAEG